MNHPGRLSPFRTVLVTGGREYHDAARIFAVLDLAAQEARQRTISLRLVFGDARGVDAIAARWAALREVSHHRYIADWDKHGRAAGVIRNQQMLNSNRVDLVIAFPGGRGTADMVRRAEDAGIPVQRIPLTA